MQQLITLYYVGIINEYRRAFDIRRKLDRIECRVTQYSYEGEEVGNIVRIVEHVGLLLPRMLSIFQDPVNISGIHLKLTYMQTLSTTALYLQQLDSVMLR